MCAIWQMYGAAVLFNANKANFAVRFILDYNKSMYGFI